MNAKPIYSFYATVKTPKKYKGQEVYGAVCAINETKARKLIREYYEGYYTFSRYKFDEHICGEYVKPMREPNDSNLPL